MFNIRQAHITDKAVKWIGLITIIVTTFIYAMFMSRRTMPFAEGWYSYYAKCILSGQKVYSDFEYLFTPIYMYFITGIIKLFGYKIIVLRILGVIFFTAYAVILYHIFLNFFSSKTSCIVTIITAFYVQSVNVNVFYDYIKLMDIFCALTTFFMISFVKKSLTDSNEASEKCLLAWGIFNSLFILTKQNMGLIFWAYSVVVILFLSFYKKEGLNKTLKNICVFHVGVISIILFLCLFLLLQGNLMKCFQSTLGGAAEAKGGMFTILFGWIKNGASELRKYFFPGAVAAAFLILLKHCNPPAQSDNLLINSAHILGGGLLVLCGIFFCINYQSIAVKASQFQRINPYFIFCINVMLLLFYLIIQIKSPNLDVLIEMCLIGAFLAVSFGAGTSGGLSISESAFGLGVIGGNIFSFIEKAKSRHLFCVLQFAGMYIVMNCIGFKMTSTYYWWEQNAPNVYECTEKSSIPILNGLLLSPEEKNVYEEIYNIVRTKTTEDENIYCFPQIPSFYLICGRDDPGVRAKVQWFDVTTKNSIADDMDTLKKNPPKAIIFYNVKPNVYDSHEALFAQGEASATKMMREFLYNFIYSNGYKFEKSVTSGSNTISVYIKEGSALKEIFSGKGTKQEPYIINTKEDLKEFSKQVNEGRNFAGQYICQQSDIDLEGDAILPIGISEKLNYFYGIYDGNGHIIKNFHIESSEESYNNGLFGTLGGKVYNLGLVNAEVYGDCCGGIASHSIGSGAAIINCFTDIQIDASSRAGGLADNFYGTVYNSFSVGETKSDLSSDIISYDHSENSLENVTVQVDKLDSMTYCAKNHNDNIIYAPKDYFSTELFVRLMNRYVDEANQNGRFEVALKNWELNNNSYYPALVKR